MYILVTSNCALAVGLGKSGEQLPDWRLMAGQIGRGRPGRRGVLVDIYDDESQIHSYHTGDRTIISKYLTYLRLSYSWEAILQE